MNTCELVSLAITRKLPGSLVDCYPNGDGTYSLSVTRHWGRMKKPEKDATIYAAIEGLPLELLAKIALIVPNDI